MATDILWVLSGPDTFRLLVRERAWATDQYRNWLAAALERELLADQAHGPPSIERPVGRKPK